MFITASQWSVERITDDMIAESDREFMPMIMALGADHAFMVQTGEDSLMVIIQFPDVATGQAALPQIGAIREMAATKFGMTMQNAVAGAVRAYR